MKKRDYSKKQILQIIVVSLAMIAAALILNQVHPLSDENDVPAMNPGAVTGSVSGAAGGPDKGERSDDTGVNGKKSEEISAASSTPQPTKDPAASIATFLQGPKSWGQRRVWSGEWGESYYDGGSFGGFGCGLCCMANIYTSLSPYECSPVDMYRFAKKKTAYSGGGAISWGFIRRTMTEAGFTCKTGKKPEKYEDFQQKVKRSQATIVVVSSSDSTCYWKDTPGHYVTLFLYDEKTDSIFLADSGDPDHNRHRVPLEKIYRSLKTASDWQYMSVTGYQESSDTWKHKGYGGNCILPEA